MSAETLYCAFCGKSQHDAFVLVAGPKVYICDGCVDLCATICAEVRANQRQHRQLDEIQRLGT
jgi:ATP-dependent Clp protease ATP-binding subunit ClpX